jgi:hypothetical protein
MPEQRYGHIIVSGDAADLSIAAKAYAGQMQPTPIGDLLTKDFRIEAHTPSEFLAKRLNVPGTKKLAWGHVVGKGLWVNNGQKPYRQIYAYRHEPFHPLFSSHITKAKAEALLKLVQPAEDGTVYANRLSEIICDMCVELFWGQGSVLDKFYGDIADKDQQKAFDILMAPDVSTPLPPVPPEPTPLPDPVIAELQAQVLAQQAEIARIKSLVTMAENALEGV